MGQSPELEGLSAPRGFFAVDYSPLENFLEQLVTAVLKTDTELSRLREENATLMQDRQQTELLRKKVEILEKKLSAAEDRIKTKADHASVSTIALEAANDCVSTAMQEVTNDLWMIKKRQDTDLQGVLSKMTGIEEQVGKVQESKADKVEVRPHCCKPPRLPTSCIDTRRVSDYGQDTRRGERQGRPGRAGRKRARERKGDEGVQDGHGQPAVRDAGARMRGCGRGTGREGERGRVVCWGGAGAKFAMVSGADADFGPHKLTDHTG